MTRQNKDHQNIDGLVRGSYMPSPDQYIELLTVDGESVGSEVLPGRMRELPSRRRHKARTRRRWPVVAVGVLLVLLLSVLGYAGFIAYNVAKISTKPLDVSGLVTDSSGRTNILVLGVGDPGHDAANLSDTIMVLSLDTRNNRIAQISVPRDLRVDIPGYGTGKINSANADGGVGTAEQTVSNTLGIPINYYVKTNFSGLKQLVDAVGGIDVNVKQRLTDPEYPCDDNQYKSCGLDIMPGLQHMDGTRALQYVRCRKGTCGNDFGRAARQQEVIGLVREKMVRWDALLNPAKLTPIVQALRGSLETDMGAVQLALLARDWQVAEKNQPVNLVFSTSPGGLLRSSGNSSDLVPVGGDFGAIQDQVQNIFQQK